MPWRRALRCGRCSPKKLPCAAPALLSVFNATDHKCSPALPRQGPDRINWPAHNVRNDQRRFLKVILIDTG